MGRVYIYVVDRDFGFAPNPFNGFCTLATCKPGIRSKAVVGDWIIGMGGSRLKAVGRCVYAMCVSAKITFNEYWTNPMYLDKKPVRNGSRKMMVGDNIYYFNPATQNWQQADSHHSKADGSANVHNLAVDTKSDKVLISRHFIFFGIGAPEVPQVFLGSMKYKNGRNYRVFDTQACQSLINWLQNNFKKSFNTVVADPFDFSNSEKRFSVQGNKII
jgi:hypothetical protein